MRRAEALLQKQAAAATLLDARALPDGGAWITQARAKAAKRLRAMGLPARRDEYWRFTRPEALNAKTVGEAAILPDRDRAIFAAAAPLRIVFVDGVLDPDASDALKAKNLVIETLDSAGARDIHWCKEVFGLIEAGMQSPIERPLAALNTAFATEGLVIRATGTVDKPINIRYLRRDPQAIATVHHVIRLDEGADLTLLEDGPAAARLSKVIEVDVADGAAFHHVRAQGPDHQRLAHTHVFARLSNRASFKSFTLTINGALTRNEAVIELNGDDAHATIAGACVGEGAFHHDDTVFVTHDARNCESRQVFKKVLKNGATGVFQGKILVRPDAQKTDGYQISQALLLDDDARFLAKPELEIHADDVACSHGSTVGAIDETALFYLTSRGIERGQAQNMLVLAFLAEALEEIENPAIRDNLATSLQGWIERHQA
ncbi:MAG: Fe-S cluster assembly protein SufD [Paracoccaceae bacterium]